jgi:hypothetical protein
VEADQRELASGGYGRGKRTAHGLTERKRGVAWGAAWRRRREGPGTVQREGGRGGLADGKTRARQHQVEQHGSRGAARSWRGAYGEMAGGLACGKRKERKNGPGQGNSATF